MRFLFYVVAASFILVACNQDSQYRVSGKISHCNNQNLVFARLDLNKEQVLDSVKVNDDGEFTFKGKRLKEPGFYKLKLSPDNFITLLIDSCEKIEISADAVNLEGTYVVKNSLGSNYIKVLNRKLKSTRNTLDSLSNEYKKLSVSEVFRKHEIQKEYLMAIDKHKKFLASFVMENPRSFASYYAVFQKFSNDEYVLNVMDKEDQIPYATIATSLNLLYPESERVKQLYSYVLRARMMQRQQEKTQVLLESAESGIPDIKESTPDGQTISLKSLKGKVVLLSFWASWDANSRKENKTLVELYAKYKARGFEIYQVSLDRSNVLWELAIEQDGCSWINVSDLQYTSSYPARVYNIQTLPANYLISREGEIIGKDLFGRRLAEKLETLL